MKDMKSCKTVIEQWMNIHGLEYNELFYVILDKDCKYTCYIGADLKPGYCPTMKGLYTIFGRQMRQMLIAMGNCYRTEQDARNDIEKWHEVFIKDEKFFKKEF